MAAITGGRIASPARTDHSGPTAPPEPPAPTARTRRTTPQDGAGRLTGARSCAGRKGSGRLCAGGKGEEGPRGAVLPHEGPARSGARERATGYTLSVAELTEHAVVGRVPSLIDESLTVLARREPVTVPPGTRLADCLEAIQRTGTGDSVFVCTPDGRLLGVLTERDIFGRLVPGDVDLSLPVESLMTTEPRTLRLEQTVGDAIDLMQTGRYRNVPLVDDDRRMVGVVRQIDIIKFLAESFPEELLNLPPRPHQAMKEPEGA